MRKNRKLRWKEKLEGMDGGRLVKQVYEGDIAVRRPRGRPKERWSVILNWRNGLCDTIPFIEHTILY